MNKRQRRQAVKADLLDTLAMTCRAYEGYGDIGPRHGLSEQECYAVADELADQLDRWAVRITPHEPADG